MFNAEAYAVCECQFPVDFPIEENTEQQILKSLFSSFIVRESQVSTIVVYNTIASSIEVESFPLTVV